MKTVIAAICVFSLGLAAALFSVLRPAPEESALPWLDVQCRPMWTHGGDKGMGTVFEHDGMRMAFWIVYPLKRNNHPDQRFVFDAEGELASFESDWAALKANYLGPEYGGERARSLSVLQQRTRGLRVDMRSHPDCHDPRRMWSPVARFIESQR